ncbi:Y-family DNA polymerase [Thalassotalea agariperforans]
MYALVDAVSYYASAEKVFDPSIRNKPVVVLTNNDGCVCAVCPIAKQLGIPKFKPYFQIKYFLDKHHVVVRSSNYELYADLSDRMMNVIGRFCDNQYVYSIDESFLYFENYHAIINDWHSYGHKIVDTVWQETRLPVGVGFGPTATLAKAANHAAKKLSGFNGVAVIDTDKSRQDILKRMSVTDVWGIGNRLGKKLNLLGIKNAWQLANQNPKAMRSQFGVVVERTVNELNGISALSWDDVKQPKKEIFSTRSFGQRITDIDSLRAALVTHSSVVARKLRKQTSLVKRLLIFAASSPHDDNYVKRSFIYTFPLGTDNSLTMANAVSAMVPHLFQVGVQYYRCGVGAIELHDQAFTQYDLFETQKESPELMFMLDKINHRYGADTLKIATEGKAEKWQMRRAFLSPSYTSKWSDIPKINC